MCDKTVDAFLPTLKCAPDWFVTNKKFEKLDDVLFSNDDIVFVIADSDNVIFFSENMGLSTIDLNNINLDDDNFVEDDPETIIHLRLMAWCNKNEHFKFSNMTHFDSSLKFKFDHKISLIRV